MNMVRIGIENNITCNGKSVDLAKGFTKHFFCVAKAKQNSAHFNLYTTINKNLMMQFNRQIVKLAYFTIFLP